ncbi:MAG TPA: hypothetical protein VIH47_06510 [Solirubrobacterales bacterium]
MSQPTAAPLAVEPAAGPDPRAHFEAFLARLARMRVEERIRASREGGFTAWERAVWAARYPGQVPLINGEFEWIALGLADLD